MPPLEWLYRVGFSHVSYECRLIFFSSASRIRAHGFGEMVVLGADIYEIFSPRGALAAGQRAPVKTAVLWSMLEQLILLRNASVFRCAAKKNQRSSKAEPVRHTSTKKFCGRRNLHAEIFRDVHSSPESITLSSTVSITAAHTVQSAIRISEKF